MNNISRHQKWITVYLIAAVVAAVSVGSNFGTVLGILTGLGMIFIPFSIVMAAGVWLTLIRPNPEIIARATEIRRNKKRANPDAF